MKKVLVIVAVLLLSLASSAQAEERPIKALPVFDWGMPVETYSEIVADFHEAGYPGYVEAVKMVYRHGVITADGHPQLWWRSTYRLSEVEFPFLEALEVEDGNGKPLKKFGRVREAGGPWHWVDQARGFKWFVDTWPDGTPRAVRCRFFPEGESEEKEVVIMPR